MFKKMRKFRYLIVLPLLVVILTGCGNNDDEQVEEIIKKKVEIQQIAKQNEVSTNFLVSGTIVPKQYSVIRSLTPGTIEYLAPVGSQVVVGQPLFSIRDQGIESGYFNALQSFEQTQATTQQQVQQAELGLNSAKARLDLSRAQYDNAVAQTEQNMNATEDSAVVAYNSAYNAIFNVVFNYNRGTNLEDPVYSLKDLVSANPELRSDTTFHYNRTVDNFLTLPETVTADDLSTALDSIYESLSMAKTLVDNTAILLQNAIASEGYNSFSIENDKANNGSNQLSVNTHISTILSTISNLENTKINNRLAIDNAQSQLDLSEIEYNNADIGLANAKDNAALQTSSARTQLDSVAYNYNNLTLAAPFSGTILSHYANAGEQATVGQELIEIGNLSIVEITVDVDVDFAKAIDLNDTVMINDQFEGIVSEIEPIGDLTSGKISVKVQSQENENLVAGDTAEVKFNLMYEEIDTIVVPIKSVTIEASGNYVFVIGEGDKIERKNVSLGQIFGDKVSVVSGLDEGDRMVLLNGVFVAVGDEVEVIQQ